MRLGLQLSLLSLMDFVSNQRQTLESFTLLKDQNKVIEEIHSSLASNQAERMDACLSVICRIFYQGML